MGCGAFAHLACLARETLVLATVTMAGKFAQAAEIITDSSAEFAEWEISFLCVLGASAVKSPGTAPHKAAKRTFF